MRLHKLFEGYKVLPSIDRDRYTPVDGLEGPFRLRNGMVVYYDPKEGSYYDRDRDMYLSYDEYRDADRDTDMVRESEEIAIEVSPGSARRALEILDNLYRGKFDHNGSNYYVFDNEQIALDVLQDFEDQGIDILDHTVGYDIDESVDNEDASVQADYVDPQDRFVVILDIGKNRYHAMGIGQYGEQIPLERSGFKDIDSAIDHAEELLGEAIVEAELEEGVGDQIVDYEEINQTVRGATRVWKVEFESANGNVYDAIVGVDATNAPGEGTGLFVDKLYKYDENGENLALVNEPDVAKRIADMLEQEHVMEESLEEGVNDPHIFKAIFLAGGPGSGKSYVAKKLTGHTGLRTVNSDEIYEYLMKKQELPLDPETIFSPQGQEIRGKAKEITAKRRGHYLDGRIGLVIDGTGKDVGKVKAEQKALKELGYDTMMLFINTSLDVAQKRNMQRERSLEPAKVEKMWKTVQDNLMAFQQVFGAANFHVVDNSGGLEDPERAENFNRVSKAIDKFVNNPPSSHIAKKWINQQQPQEPVAEASEETLKMNHPEYGLIDVKVLGDYGNELYLKDPESGEEFLLPKNHPSLRSSDMYEDTVNEGIEDQVPAPVQELLTKLFTNAWTMSGKVEDQGFYVVLDMANTLGAQEALDQAAKQGYSVNGNTIDAGGVKVNVRDRRAGNYETNPITFAWKPQVEEDVSRLRKLAGLKEEQLSREEYIAKKAEIEAQMAELIPREPQRTYWERFARAKEDPEIGPKYAALQKQLGSLQVKREPVNRGPDKYALDAPTLPGGRSPSH